jgi:hypothetical protein
MPSQLPEPKENDNIDCHLQQVGMGSLICRAARQTGDKTTNEVNPTICFNCDAGKVYRDIGCDAILPKIRIYPYSGGSSFQIESLLCKIRKRETTLDYCKTCNLVNAETTRHIVCCQPCSCPEVKAEAVEPVVWETICQLIKDPHFLIQELHKRNAENSQTKEILERELQLCQARLKAIPDEQRRLVEGYRKGLYADFMMREDMEIIQKEQGELEKRKAELERQLAQRQLTDNQEVRIRNFAEKISSGLDTLDFAGRQELLRLLIEKVLFDGRVVEIQTIIAPDEQLHPIHRPGESRKLWGDGGKTCYGGLCLW